MTDDTTDATASLAVTALTIAFPTPDGGQVMIVDDLSFAAEPGQMVCIAGRSGSGKTSVLRRLVGLVVPEPATVFWNNRDVATIGAGERAGLRRTLTAYVDQDAGLVDDLNCLDNALLSVMPAGRNAVREARTGAEETLNLLGLTDRSHAKPRTLSGGERQRTALARALVADTPALVADEPTASLDRHTADTIIEILRARADAGGTIVIASHDPSVAAAADHIIRIEEPANAHMLAHGL